MTAGIDITTGQRKTLLALLRRYIPGAEVWAYGSRVRWNARPNSDLDLVAFTTPAQRQQVSELKEALGESNIPFLVDLHVWDDVPERFHAIIRKEYVVLQKKEEKCREDDKTSEWRKSKWGEEISLEYGKALRGEDDTNAKFRVFGSNGPIGWTSQPLVQGPGVILGRKGAYRGVQYSREPFFVIDTAYYVVPKTDLDMRWLYYAIKHYKLGDIDDGSPIPSTTRSAVYMQDIQVPQLPEQKAIAHILGTLDDKIELNRRINKTLEVMARALFQSWFVDFDPVRRNADRTDDSGLTRRRGERGGEASQDLPPLRASAPLRDPNDALFPAHFQESPLGPIPEGWEVQSLGEVVELAYGKPLKTEDRKGGPIPVYGSNGLIGWHNEKLVSGPGIVVGRKGNPGVVTWVHDDFYPIDTSFYVVPIGICRSLYFIYYALSNHNLANLSADSAVPGLNRNHAYMSKQIIPGQNLLEDFDSQISSIFVAIHANVQQSRNLTSLRETLLPKLLSGEIRIKDTEQYVEEIL